MNSLFQSLPFGLADRIEQRPGLVRILNNIGWLFFDKFLRMAVGLLVGVWVARYLGPEQFGLLSYAIAFTALFSAIAGLGLNGIVVRDLIQNPADSKITMGTAFLLQILGGICAFGLAILTILFIRPDDRIAKLAVTILAFVMVFKAADVVRYWFEAKVQSKYVVWVENIVFLVVSAIKIGLIFSAAPLMAFVWVLFAEGVMVAIGLIVIYERFNGGFKTWRVRFDRARNLFGDSWPLTLSGLAVMVYMRIDQVMLGQMAGDGVVGIYSAAVKISEVWYFIPIIISASVFPSIIKAKNAEESLYHNRLQNLFNVLVMVALIVAIPMSFLSDRVVIVIFGPLYHQAGTVLAIHIWSGIFVSMAVASGKWFLIENLQSYVLYRTLSGAVVNVVLNLLLIPQYGILGAAWATVASQACAGMFYNILNRKTRHLFIMQCKSLFLIGGFSRKG